MLADLWQACHSLLFIIIESTKSFTITVLGEQKNHHYKEDGLFQGPLSKVHFSEKFNMFILPGSPTRPSEYSPGIASEETVTQSQKDIKDLDQCYVIQNLLFLKKERKQVALI